MPREALRRLGEEGPGLVRRARGEDDRVVDPARETKSISAETTFDSDLADLHALERHLWRMTEKLAGRLKRESLCAGGVVLKLKTADFRLRTRAARLASPSLLPDTLFTAARALLAREADGTAVPPDRPRRQPAAARRAGRPAGSDRPRCAAAECASGSDRCAADAVRGGDHRQGAIAGVRATPAIPHRPIAVTHRDQPRRGNRFDGQAQ